MRSIGFKCLQDFQSSFVYYSNLLRFLSYGDSITGYDLCALFILKERERANGRCRIWCYLYG